MMMDIIKSESGKEVNFLAIKDFAKVSIGEFVHKSKQNPSGKYPVYNGGTGNTGFYDEYNRTANKIIVSARGANAGYVNRVFVDFWSGNSCYSIDVIDENVDWNYIYYCLKNGEVKLLGEQQKGGIPAVSKKQVEQFKIPLPPLPIQQEIVRILDTFTNLTAELTARRKQYEYYRDELLTFGEDIERRTIGDVCLKIASGGTPATGKMEYYGGDIPWLRTQEVDWNDIWDTGVKISKAGLENSSAKWIPENCVVVAMYGATAAKVAVNRIPLTTNQACCNLLINEKIVMHRYVFYWLSKEYLHLKEMGQGSQSNINAKIIRNYLIPIPPMERQQYIVSILDRFRELCSAFSGISEEILLRQKQYEYYRDKLLNFREK